jgi:hypothetical protein
MVVCLATPCSLAPMASVWNLDGGFQRICTLNSIWRQFLCNDVQNLTYGR